MTGQTTPPFTLHKKKPLWTLGVILSIFAIPLVLAGWGSKHHDNFGYGSTNHGQLISPPLDLVQLNLKTPKAQWVEPTAWRGRWLLLYVNSGVCDRSCGQQLYYLRQIRIATGKESDRVSRAILTFSDQPSNDQLELILTKNFSGTLHFITSTAEFKHFLHNEPMAIHERGIYLVDPLGNVLMYYPNKTEPMGIYKDLMRLLKLSHIG